MGSFGSRVDFRLGFVDDLLILLLTFLVADSNWPVDSLCPSSEHEVHGGFEVGDSSKDTIQRDRESMHLSSTTTDAPVWVSSHAIDQPPTLPPSLSCPRSHCHHQPACRLSPSPAICTWKLVISDASYFSYTAMERLMP
ncbi:hypothetical protein L1887_15063 [Cichorium endivia]|nr:hypothetical protein L1887_15063 [Cichorium endivia]